MTWSVLWLNITHGQNIPVWNFKNIQHSLSSCTPLAPYDFYRWLCPIYGTCYRVEGYVIKIHHPIEVVISNVLAYGRYLPTSLSGNKSLTTVDRLMNKTEDAISDVLGLSVYPRQPLILCVLSWKFTTRGFRHNVV